MYTFKFSDLKGKCLLITGTSSGIGKALVSGFLLQGLRLIVVNKDDVSCDEFPTSDISFYQCDLACQNAVRKLVEEIREKESRLDFIIHNAAIDPRKAFEESDEAFWGEVLQVNLLSAVTVTRGLLPLLKENEAGRIIFTSSVMDPLGGAFMSAYAASKGAVSAVARSLAHELKGTSITVNSIVPGAIMVEKEKFLTSENNNQIIDWQCVPRRLTPADLLGPLCLLLSSAGGAINGQQLIIDGGILHPIAGPGYQHPKN